MRLLPTLVALFTVGPLAVRAGPYECNDDCQNVDNTRNCGHTFDPPEDDCLCQALARGKNGNLFVHKTGTKVEIFGDNTLHMFCKDSRCYRNSFCRIRIEYSNKESYRYDASYMLPSYEGCCKLPRGDINKAEMHAYDH